MFKIKNAAIVFTLIILSGLSGCIKEKYAIDHVNNTNRLIVEFTQGETEIHPINLDFVAGIIDTNLIEIRIPPRSRERLQNDIRVKLVPNPTLVADYNAANGSSFTVPPASAFMVESYDVVIPKSTGAALLKVKINPAEIVAGEFAIGFSIAEVSEGEISKLRNNILVSIGIKNKYDGVYSVTGTCVDANGVYSSTYPKTVELITVGNNSVDYFDVDYGGFYYIVETIASGTPAILIRPRFVFNTVNDKLAEIHNSSTGAPYVVNIDPVINQFTSGPAGKSFQIKYLASSSRFTITETWTYTGSR